MVSVPAIRLPDELNEVISALAKVADERALPVLFKRFGDDSQFCWDHKDLEQAREAILQIAQRVGSASYSSLLEACNGPAARCMIGIEALCRLRHPEVYNILKQKWNQLESAGPYKVAILMETLRQVGDANSIPFCLSLTSSNSWHVHELLFSLLERLLELHGSAASVPALESLCKIPDCVRADWRPEIKIETVPRLPRPEDADWIISFNSVRLAASNELKRRGVSISTTPFAYRRL